MSHKTPIKNSSPSRLEAALLCEHIVELDEQHEELVSGGTSFTGEDRLRTRFSRLSLTPAELVTLNEGVASVASQYGIRSIPTLMLFKLS